MKKCTITLLTLVSSMISFAQRDTIYSNNEKIIGSVIEISPDAVTFKYPDEDLINSIYKNSVQKIVFKNGRIQTFSEGTSYKKISGVEDFENVSVAQVESEVKGLYKIGEVSSKAKGTTVYSNQERVKQRAYKKLKIEAAMMGANVIFLTHQRTEGNKYGGYFQSSSSAETNLSGIAYSNSLPLYDNFKSLIGNKKDFVTKEKYELYSSSSEYKKAKYVKNFTINEIINENGVIFLKGNLEGVKKYNRFRLASYNEDSFSIYYEDKNTSYNITIQI